MDSQRGFLVAFDVVERVGRSSARSESGFFSIPHGVVVRDVFGYEMPIGSRQLESKEMESVPYNGAMEDVG